MMKQMKQLHALCKSTDAFVRIVHDYRPEPVWYVEVVFKNGTDDESPAMPNYRKAAEYAIARITEFSANPQTTHPIQG